MTVCYSWQDVEAVFQQGYKEKWSDIWKSVTVYQDEVFIRVDADHLDEAESLSLPHLKELFGGGFRDQRILLHYGGKHLPVYFEEAESDSAAPRYIPVFKQLKKAAIKREPLSGKPVIAFHSYKGGVGRTLSLLAFVRAVKKKGSYKKLLIIDGDTEAPGLSWLMQKEYSFDFSFYDTLSLLHEHTDWRSGVLSFVKEKISQVPVKIPIDDVLTEHYFLPAYREDYQLLSPPVTPEQVVRGRGKEWVLTDFLSALGEELGVDAVIVDLRAGISEYSAPFLLDPAVRDIFITSTSLQSVEGTKKILNFKDNKRVLHKEKNQFHFSPIIGVSMVPEDILEREKWRLYQEFGQYFDESKDELFNIRFMKFAQELIHLDYLDSIDRKLSGTSMEKEWISIVEDYFSRESDQAALTMEERESFLSRLYSLGDQMEFAEKSDVQSFMKTSALKQLMAKYQFDVPKAVVLGTKGSGKTFNYIQLIQARTWEKFSTHDHDQETIIVPVMYSSSLEDKALEKIRSQLSFINDRLQTNLTIQDLIEFTNEIKEESARGTFSEVAWQQFWEQQMIRLLGASSLQELNQFLQKKQKRILFIMDGFENVFQDIVEDHAASIKAIRGICEGLMNEWRSDPETNVGLVVFARTDFVQKAIKQNFAQFRSLYKSFELRWTHTEALKLVLWMARQCDERNYSSPVELDDMGKMMIEEVLYPLWGRKLGKEQSREAKTAEWVLYVLADFHGRLQARDIIRFLKYAAFHSQGQTAFLDRMLVPKAIRKAVASCSEGKIEELKMEDAVLSTIFDKMKDMNPDDKTIPFEVEDLQLSSGEVEFLVSNGFLVYDEEGCYLPEIVSKGLGFKPSRKGRTKVLQFTRSKEL
ncbi:hypothetical protein BTO30_01555 [Domibacillus antri]|uniref:AAA domain-containing protein n=1 Tax=Domibacillus antri TaxID=1714264 RepID=A0A1Q8QA27_9BACI|nr:hypothetical protein [Domibacillus antri]OLN24125.1 hypothetical protein BTO30_01555 [Domibacillus antri]